MRHFLPNNVEKYSPKPDNIWVQLIKAKYLKNNMNFFQSKKTSPASKAWNHILDYRYVLKKCLNRILVMEKALVFGSGWRTLLLWIKLITI